MRKLMKQSQNNILSTPKSTATVKLQNQKEVWEGPSPEKPNFCTDVPTSGRSARSKRQTSAEISWINYCRGINWNTAEICNTGFVRREYRPASSPKCPIRQDLHTDESCLYFFFFSSQQNRNHNQNLRVLKTLVDVLSSQILLSLESLERISYKSKYKTHWHDKMVGIKKNYFTLK